MNSKLFCNLFYTNPFHFRNLFSTLSVDSVPSQTLFSYFASSKLNMSNADITRIFKIVPSLQRLQTLENVEQFVNMLHKRGFSQVEITNVMRSNPRIIRMSVEKLLEPKIKLLEGIGFQGQTLKKLLTYRSGILNNGPDNGLHLRIKFLKSLFQSQNHLVRAMLRGSFALTSNLEKTLKPSVAFWEGLGFTGTDLSKFLSSNPRALASTSLTPAQIDLIQKISCDKESKMFKYIVSKVVGSRIETLEAKIENLKLCGFSTEETWQIIRTYPTVLDLSKEYTTEKINFIVNTMKLPLNHIVKHPILCGLSLEKTMRPRFLVLQKIIDMNGFGFPAVNVVTMSEAKFVSKIIRSHPESETLLSIYQNAMSSSLKGPRSSTKR